MLRSLLIAIVFVFLFSPIYSQSLEDQLQSLQSELELLISKQKLLEANIETIKLRKIIQDLKDAGLPSKNYIEHTAMIMEYDEEHEQAKWVAHILTPDVISSSVFRTNDFRPDPKVKTGSAIEEDYFLKYLQTDGTYKYDGYGYDRGHLAPSADFRWSQQALSESYYYSNISPQLPEFNREKWAELEALIRSYIYRNPNSQVLVITIPLYGDTVEKVERSKNGVSIPDRFLKIVLDRDNQSGIAFDMPHQKLSYPLESFAISIDQAEMISGYDFFSRIRDSSFEAATPKEEWIPEMKQGDAEPIYPPSLPKNHFNSVQAKQKIGTGKEYKICGKVVSTRYSRSGNLWLNIDKQFPNQILSVFVKKEHLINFSYDPQKEWMSKTLCFIGQVEELNGTPTINIERETKVIFYSPPSNK